MSSPTNALSRRRSRERRRSNGSALRLLAIVPLLFVLACLERPVVPAEPQTTNVFVDQIVQNAVDKIDLLFMIDNSISMADKQELLRRAVPVLLNRLITPLCVDVNGEPLGTTVDASGNCAVGEPEFSPIRDIHIGVITSSLGAIGA